MNTITFPGLNLIFNISRIAFSINSIHIYWYAILIVLAIIIGIIIFKVNDRKVWNKICRYNRLMHIFNTNFNNMCKAILCIIWDRLLHKRTIANFQFKKWRTCNIWWNNRWSSYLLYILQKEKNKYIGLIRFYSIMFSTSDKQLEDGETS